MLLENLTHMTKQQDRTVWLQKSGHVTCASKHLKAIRIF